VYQEGLANATKRGYHRRVRAMLRWAERKDLVPDMPDMPPPPKKRDSLTEVITEEELLQVCRAHWAIPYSARWHPQMWCFLYYQGLRPGEAYDLRIANIYLNREQVQIGDHTKSIRAKSGDEALIPLLSPGRFYARPFYRGTAWAEERSRDGSDRLFGAGPGARRPSSSFKRAVREAAKDEGSTITEARAERISMYTLRHSCATHWLREGKSLIWVNRLLRHSQVQTTMEYVHLAGVDLQNMG
jgi:integrase